MSARFLTIFFIVIISSMYECLKKRLKNSEHPEIEAES